MKAKRAAYILKEEPPEIVAKYIDSGHCVIFRRWIKKQFMVYDKHPMSKNFLKSSAAIRNEKTRHLQYYYYTIHPFSKARIRWEMLMAVLIYIYLIIVPIEEGKKAGYKLTVVRHILEFICCLDILLNFFTGYYNNKTKKIILNKKQIAQNYIRGAFITDLISSLPIVEIVGLIYAQELPENFSVCISFVKLIRIHSFLKYLHNYRDYKQYSIYVLNIMQLILVIFMLMVAFTNYVYNTANAASTAEPYTMLKSFFRALHLILLIAYLPDPDDEKTEVNTLSNDLIIVVICTIGIFLKVYIMAQILQAVSKYNSTRNKYQRVFLQLKEYIRYKGLPEDLAKRLFMFLNFRFQKQYYKENEILSALTPSLRQELALHKCKNLVEKVDFFNILPDNLILGIVSSLTSELYLPNDIIVHAGIIGNSMYFISTGTVAIYTIYGKELCHLSDGEHFGEIALLTENEQRIATVVAIDYCELFVLKRNSFLKIIGPYPHLMKQIHKVAQERMKLTIQMMLLNKDQSTT